VSLISLGTWKVSELNQLVGDSGLAEEARGPTRQPCLFLQVILDYLGMVRVL
jgi:hypothetical protein